MPLLNYATGIRQVHDSACFSALLSIATSYETCETLNGSCEDTANFNCTTGTFLDFYCDGAQEVQCCVPKTESCSLVEFQSKVMFGEDFDLIYVEPGFYNSMKRIEKVVHIIDKLLRFYFPKIINL